MKTNQTAKRFSAKKAVLIISAIVLVISCTIGGTLAWLIESTDKVENTFTYGDINITLEESVENHFKIVPGVDITKDPVVTVEANSEACYLFVKIEEANWPPFTEANGTTRKVAYALADGWTKLTGVDGVDNVYYRVVPANNAEDSAFSVLKDNKVTVSDSLTKGEINSLTEDELEPTLTFTAYAIQEANGTGTFTPATAWEQIAANI